MTIIVVVLSSESEALKKLFTIGPAGVTLPSLLLISALI